MCNANEKIMKMVAERQEYKRMMDEAKAMMETLDAEIQSYMTAMDADSMVAGAFKVTWKESVRNSLDTTLLKKTLPDIAAQFMRQTAVRTFKVA